MLDRETIIRLARKAGCSGLYMTYNEPTGEADWKMVKESLTVPVTMEQLERFAALVAAAERDACAKHAEDFLAQGRSPLGRSVAAAIRARSQQ